jgi:hypothetical protein
MGGTRSKYDEFGSAYTVLVGTKGKKPLGNPRRRWKNNIKIDLRQVLREYMDRSHLAECRGKLRGRGLG